MSASISQEVSTPATASSNVNEIGRWVYVAGLLLLYCLGTLLYWPSLAGPRLFDDQGMLTHADGVRGIGEVVSSLNWLRPETRPIVRLTFGVETYLFGDSMSVHRLGNVLIHVMAALALFGLVRRVCKQVSSVSSDFSFSDTDKTALAVSILWFVHPLQSAAVAYVAQRGESLMGLFFFLYLRSVVELITSRKAHWLIAAIVAFLLGLFSKTIMITAPVVGLLLDRAFFSQSWKEVLRGQWRLLLVPAAGAAFAAALLLPGILVGQANVGFGGDAPPFDLHLAAQAKVLWLYTLQSVWPEKLSVDHALRAPQHITDNLGWLLLTSLLFCLTASLYWFRRYAAGFLLLAPLCVLAVTSSVIPTADLQVDHRMYVPLASVMTILVVTIRRILNRLRGPEKSARYLLVLIGGIGFLFSVRTWFRAEDYRSGIETWRSALEVNPDNDRAVQNLIDATRKESPGTSIVPVLDQALRTATETGIVPTVAFGRLGEQYAQLGEAEKAISLLSRAIRLDEQHFSEGYRGSRRNTERFGMHVNMSVSLASIGQLPKAIGHINQAFRFADGSADARALAGSLSLQAGDVKAAEEHFQRALDLRPGWKDVEADLERLRQLQ